VAVGRRATGRLGVDIGGTFTDVALEVGERRFSAKILTTPDAPERAVIAAIREVLREAALAPRDLSIIIHGTTLATNAIIERKGVKTALVTTEGFRDTIEIRHENRFEQYDVNIDLPPPLVPRRLRFVVPERINAQGKVIVPLDEAEVERLADRLLTEAVDSVAIGFLHSFTNPAHEIRTREILIARLTGVTFTLSSEVSPEMREYERFSTACANAYVQPMIGRYLVNLEERLQHEGLRCPLFLMLSGGGLTTVETAIRFPVRLVESGPAGGAITAYLAAHPYDAANALQQINTQYWIATFMDGYEAWANWRRSGYPALTPVANYPGNVTNGTIPRRFTYPLTEAGVNAANYSAAASGMTGGDKMTSRMWWDKP